MCLSSSALFTNYFLSSVNYQIMCLAKLFLEKIIKYKTAFLNIYWISNMTSMSWKRFRRFISSALKFLLLIIFSECKCSIKFVREFWAIDG